jgi:hypothetical protein
MTETKMMRLLASTKVALVFLLFGLPAGAMAEDKPLPAAIAAPGETVVLAVHAVGLQLYECKPGADGKVVGKHGAGPTWELLDGSGITGKAVGNAPGATENDIAWLKLEVTSHKGVGQLDGVTTVQRINTKGGVLKGACDHEKAGEGMPYEADYVFLKKN